jgi:3-dehydroquinate synthetase
LTSEDRRPVLHGEAIAVGMILATYISSEMIGFPKRKLQQVTSTVLKHFDKVSFDKSEIEAIITLLKFDKKNSKRKSTFSYY